MTTPATKSARTRAAAHGDADAAARLRARRPAEKTLILAEDNELGAELAAAVEAERAMRFSGDETAKAEASARLETARAAVAEDAITIRLRSIGRAAYAKLQADHMPTDEDHQAWARDIGQPGAKTRFARSLRPALVAACMVDPAGIGVDELTDMLDDGRLSDGEITALFGAAIELHEGSRVADLGK